MENQVDNRDHGEEKDENDDQRSHILLSWRMGVREEAMAIVDIDSDPVKGKRRGSENSFFAMTIDCLC